MTSTTLPTLTATLRQILAIVGAEGLSVAEHADGATVSGRWTGRQSQALDIIASECGARLDLDRTESLRREIIEESDTHYLDSLMEGGIAYRLAADAVLPVSVSGTADAPILTYADGSSRSLADWVRTAREPAFA